METDALLVLVLCLLVLHFDKAGAWILAAGLMRYAFVLATKLWPWLARAAAAEPAAQGGVRGADHQPDRVPRPDHRAARGARPSRPPAWPLLAASFAIDIAWLIRHRASPLETCPMKALAPACPFAAASCRCLMAPAPPARAEPARYELDPDHITVAFLVDHLGYAKVLGMFRAARGSYSFDEASGHARATCASRSTRRACSATTPSATST